MSNNSELLSGQAIGQIERLALKGAQHQIISITDPLTGDVAPAVVINGKLEAIPADTFTDYRNRPVRIKGVAALSRIESLIEHVNRFKQPESVLFADDRADSASITAVIDYHFAGAPPAGGVSPAYAQHRAHYSFPLSDEWKVWTGANGKQMGMFDFATFIEDNINDVIQLIAGEDHLSEELERYIKTCGGGKPASPSALVELSRRLDINENAIVKNAVKLSSGEGEISFSTEHVDSDGKPVKVPGLFMIAIPVFKGGPLYRIACRLRYRAKGAISFWFEMWRADKAFEAAFSESCERVAEETELPMLFGAPEA